MGLMKGSATATAYYVEAKDVDGDELAHNAFIGVTEERKTASGWVNPFDPLSAEGLIERYNGMVFMAFRIDEVKVPKSLLSMEVQKAYLRYQEEEGSFPTAEEKKNISEEVLFDLERRIPVTTKVVEVVLSPQAKRLHIFAKGPLAVIVATALTPALGEMPVQEVPYITSMRCMGEEQTESLLGGGDTAALLEKSTEWGPLFLTWIAYRQLEGIEESGSELGIEGKVVMAREKKKVSIQSSDPVSEREFIESLRDHKVPVSATMYLVHTFGDVEKEWSFSYSAPTGFVASAKLPATSAETRTERAFDRILHLDDLHRALGEFYKKFLTLMSDPSNYAEYLRLADELFLSE